MKRPATPTRKLASLPITDPEGMADRLAAELGRNAAIDLVTAVHEALDPECAHCGRRTGGLNFCDDNCRMWFAAEVAEGMRTA